MTSEAQVLLFPTLSAGTSLFSQLPPIDFPILAIVTLVLVALLLWFNGNRASRTSPAAEIPTDQMVESLSASTRPLFPSTEASLLNMIRLAVQDSYLVFAKLPLSAALTIDAKERDVRKAIMRATQHIRVDLALVHPGTLQLEKIIRFKTSETSVTPLQPKEQLVAAILESADIETITLETNTPYTVPQLLTLLGLGEED